MGILKHMIDKAILERCYINSNWCCEPIGSNIHLATLCVVSSLPKTIIIVWGRYYNSSIIMNTAFFCGVIEQVLGTQLYSLIATDAFC